MRKIVDASPVTAELNTNLIKLWQKSKFLNERADQIKRGFVFIHVPKTAGTSLNQALRITGSSDVVAHSLAKEFLPMIKRIYPKVISIAFVRNPYSRFISLYNYATLGETYFHSVKDPAKSRFGKHFDYDTLMGKSLDQCAELLIQEKLGQRPDHTISMWRPQVDWLVDWQGKIMVDYIGRVETLDADLKYLRDHYGIVTDPVPWLNKSTDKENTPIFTERARDLARLYYKRDFEMLGYND